MYFMDHADSSLPGQLQTLTREGLSRVMAHPQRAHGVRKEHRLLKVNDLRSVA